MTASPKGVVLRFGPLHGEDMAVLGEEECVGDIVEGCVWKDVVLVW
jgi:hypothetical protein